MGTERFIDLLGGGVDL